MEKLEIAPQTALRFVLPITRVFMTEILGKPHAFVTDEASLSLFTHFKAGTRDYEHWRMAVIHRSAMRFGVDITGVFERKIPELMHFIQANRRRL